jgi:hypothetical protein
MNPRRSPGREPTPRRLRADRAKTGGGTLLGKGHRQTVLLQTGRGQREGQTNRATVGESLGRRAGGSDSRLTHAIVCFVGERYSGSLRTVQPYYRKGV